MTTQINVSHVLSDVLSAFPVIGTTLKDDLHINTSDVKDGETVGQFFNRISLTAEEVTMVLRKVNFKLSRFLTNRETEVYTTSSVSEIVTYDYDSEAELEEE